MCVLNIFDKFLPDLRAFDYRRYGEIEPGIFLVDLRQFRIGYFLVDKRVVNLYLLK